MSDSKMAKVLSFDSKYQEVDVSSSPLKDVDLNAERKKKQVEEFEGWLHYVLISCVLSITFGAMWVDMTNKKLEKQQNNEDFRKSTTLYQIGLACYLFVIVAFNLMKCPKRNAIWKIATGGDRDDENIDENNYILHSIGFSAFIACCSHFLVVMLLWELNDVAEMIVVKYQTHPGYALYAWSFYPSPFAFGITSFLSLGVVSVFRTYRLLVPKSKMPLSGHLETDLSF